MAWQEIGEGGVFEGEVDTPMHTMTAVRQPRNVNNCLPIANFKKLL